MHVFKHPKYYKELRDAGNELAKRNAVKEDLACSGSSPARNKSDQVISKEPATAGNQRAPGPGHKPQDNNASFESISEAEYNKRHMKALKDADPGLMKLQATSKYQAASFKLSNQPVQAPSDKHQALSNKRQAPSHKLQAP